DTNFAPRIPSWRNKDFVAVNDVVFDGLTHQQRLNAKRGVDESQNWGRRDFPGLSPTKISLHGGLPTALPAKLSDISMAIKARDESCRVTGATEAGETAHVIAVKLQRWFMDQAMYD
ncbi:MAG: hypothetical protein LQ349_000812, partial [Xanthoria aureola]